jgi:dihydropyrimidinase
MSSTKRTLIKNGTIVTATDTYAADVWIEGGVIAAITQRGRDLGTADVIVDAAGKYVMPGGIDAHTHLDMPFGGTTSSDDFETGTSPRPTAAPRPSSTSPSREGRVAPKGLDAWHQKAEGKAAIDYGFHMIATDINDSTLGEMKAVVDEGVTSFKLFMAYPASSTATTGRSSAPCRRPAISAR